MRFELHSNSTNEQNIIFVNIIDDDGKTIGHTRIQSVTYKTHEHLKEQMQHVHKTTRKACMEAARHIEAPGNIAYVGIIELDYRERGRGYGPKVLQYVPQICKQFGLPMPDVVCAYILPNGHRLDIQTYQNQLMSNHEWRQMRRVMHKTFQRAGFKESNWLLPHVVTKVVRK